MSSSAIPARAPKTRMFDGSELEKELLNLHAASLTLPVLSEFVKLRLAKLEADHQRGIPFNEAIGNDELGLDIMARGILQDWLGTLFSQYDVSPQSCCRPPKPPESHLKPIL